MSDNTQTTETTTSTTGTELSMAEKWAQADVTVQKQDPDVKTVADKREGVREEIEFYPTDCEQRMFLKSRVRLAQLLTGDWLNPRTLISFVVFDNDAEPLADGNQPSTNFVCRYENLRMGPAVTRHNDRKELEQIPQFIQIVNARYVFGQLPKDPEGNSIKHIELTGNVSAFKCYIKPEDRVRRQPRALEIPEELQSGLTKVEKYFLTEHSWPKGGMPLGKAKDLMIDRACDELNLDFTENEELLKRWSNELMNQLKKVWRETGVWDKEPTRRQQR